MDQPHIASKKQMVEGINNWLVFVSLSVVNAVVGESTRGTLVHKFPSVLGKSIDQPHVAISLREEW